MPRRPAPVTGHERGRGRPARAAAAKVRWHREFPSRPHSQGVAQLPESVMISRILAADVAATAGEHVMIAGWLHRTRQLTSMTFLIVRDRSGLAQAVLTDPAAIDAAAALPEETVIRVEGTVTASPQAPGGAELTRPAVTASLPAILDGAPTTLRHPLLRAPFEIAAASAAGFRAALGDLGFTEVFTPKIVASATESGANVFGIDYFGTPAYLAQSPQFYKQAMVGVFERVFEVGPVFRAEP